MLGNKVSDLTVDEFRSIIRETIRQTLADMMIDHDSSLALQDGLEKSLEQSIKSVKEGGESYSVDEVARKSGLE